MLLLLAFVAQAQSPLFYAYGNIQSRTVVTSNTYNITISNYNGGYREYPNANFDVTDIVVGDVVWAGCVRFQVTQIISTAPLVLRVSDALSSAALTGTDLINARCLLIHEAKYQTFNLGAFGNVADGNAGSQAGVSPFDMGCIQNYYRNQLSLALGDSVSWPKLKQAVKDSIRAKVRCAKQQFTNFSGSSATFSALAGATEIRNVYRGGALQTYGLAPTGNYTTSGLVVAFNSTVSAQDVVVEGCTGTEFPASGESGSAGGLEIDTITQTAHGLRKMDAVLDTSYNSIPKFIKGRTTSASLLPSHLVVDSLDANRFVIQSCGYFKGSQNRFTAKQVYYLQDDGSYGASPDAQFNFPVFGISSSNTVIYLRIDAASVPYIANVLTDVTSSRILAITDVGSVILMNNASTNTLIVPNNSTAAFSIGTQITVSQTGAGQTVFAPAGGVIISAADAADRLRTQYSTATLTKIATNTWLLSGDITN